MWYLYLDESGDLGFDFVNKRPSKFFTVSILLVKGGADNLRLLKAVKKTIKRKLNPKSQRNRSAKELKGTNTTLEIKRYFYSQIKDVDFSIYSLTLNKKRVYDSLIKDKPRVYNFISRLVLDQISFYNAGLRVELIIDKSKSRPEITDFNNYIRRQLEAKLDPKVPLDIYHWKSEENGGVQAADLFSWGIFRKYEKRDSGWYDIFRGKVRYDDVYLR
jgi:hypothetical protein